MSKPSQTMSEEPRAVQNGMSRAEYDTWMFLADKEGLDQPYTYAVKQSDLTKFLREYALSKQIEGLKELLREHAGVCSVFITGDPKVDCKFESVVLDELRNLQKENE